LNAAPGQALNKKIKKANDSTLLSFWKQPRAPTSPFSEATERIFCAESSDGKDGLMVIWDEKEENFNSVSCHLRSDREQDSIISWTKKLVGLVETEYGSIQNMRTRGWSNPYDLKLRLPEIPWGSIYGSRYLELFGSERIRSAPFSSVSELASNTLLCTLSDSLKEHEITKDKRRAIRDFLNPDAFMEGSRMPRHYKSGVAPHFQTKRTNQ